MKPRVQVVQQGDAIRVQIEGVLDHDATSDLTGKTRDLVSSVNSDVALDLGRVEYISSECVGVLITLGRKIKEKGYAMRVVAASEIVDSVLTVCGFFKIFNRDF